MKRPTPLSDMSRRDPAPIARIDPATLDPLGPGTPPAARAMPAPPPPAASVTYDLDGSRVLVLPNPQTPEEEQRLVEAFLSGLEKLFSREDNWTFLQPLVLSMEHCAHCQTCADACHIFESSGQEEIYRPTYRSEILRRLYFEHVKGGGLISAWQHGTVELNWPMIARLAELAYRCNLCRRCAQTCPIGVDNGLIAHEIRKLFSQEMGIAPKELHASGSMLQIKSGSTTGMNPAAVKDNVQFIDEEMSEKTGLAVETPWDVEGADILLIHNAGEVLAWPENPGAFGVILNAAGISWTMSSEIAGYDSVNYGVWYDDAQFARVALLHAQAAKKLKVKKIVVGECGHAHKALLVIADRLLTGDLEIPRESFLTVLRDIVVGGRLKLDPVTQRLPRHAARSLQHRPPHGHRRAAAGDHAAGVPAVPRDAPARRGQLLLRRRQRVRHHEPEHVSAVARRGVRAQEGAADPRRVLGLPRPGDPEVRLRPVQQLQGADPRHPGLPRHLEASPHPVRRPRRARRQRDDRREARLHRVGVALTPAAGAT